jgi:hypothetical protein
MALMILLRRIMSKENKRRNAEPKDTTYDEVYIERVNSDGSIDKIRVEKVQISTCRKSSNALLITIRSGIFGPHRYSEPRLPLRVVARYLINSEQACLMIFLEISYV